MRQLAVTTLFLLTACSPQSPNTESQSALQVIANCEQKAYAQIGVQSDELSSLEYALNKHELVRACAVSSGLRFRTEAWSAFYPKLYEQTYRRYDIFTESPSSAKYQSLIGEADKELKRQTAIAQGRSEFWE